MMMDLKATHAAIVDEDVYDSSNQGYNDTRTPIDHMLFTHTLLSMFPYHMNLK